MDNQSHLQTSLHMCGQRVYGNRSVCIIILIMTMSCNSRLEETRYRTDVAS